MTGHHGAAVATDRVRYDPWRVLVLFPLVLAAIASALILLLTLLARTGCRRYGAAVGPMAMVPLLSTGAYAVYASSFMLAETQGPDAYGRMAAWAFLFGGGAVGVVSLGGVVVLIVAAVQAHRATGRWWVDGAGLLHTLRRGVMIVVWCAIGLVIGSLLTVLPIQLIYGDTPPPVFEQIGGLAILGVLTGALVLGFGGRLPGTARLSSKDTNQSINLRS